MRKISRTIYIYLYCTSLSTYRRLHGRKFRQTSYDSLTNHSTVRFTRITYFRRYHDFRDNNDPLREPELGHSGQYFRQSRSSSPRLDERPFHVGREKKGGGLERDINRENTAVGTLAGPLTFHRSGNPRLWRGTLSNVRDDEKAGRGRTGQEVASSRFRMNGFR